MALPASPLVFAHRKNADGTIDSICCQCFFTVCNSVGEAALEEREHSHLCDPSVLEDLKTLGQPRAPAPIN